MEYVITDGSNYLAATKSGMTVVSNISSANRFTIEKANNVLKSIPKHLKKYNWNAKEETTDNIESIEQKQNTDYDGLTDNILEKMLDWENYIKKLKEYLVVIDSKLLTINAEFQDILHCSEFFDLDLYRAWQLNKMLQDSRKRRRKLKDEKAKIEYILKSNFVDCTQSAISKYIIGMEDRTYLPRIYQELFNRQETKQ